jgi:acylphosphatase
VSGRVQGVWFRDSTRKMADELGITGHAINLSNGNVEVLATGAPDTLDRLKAWLREGPPLASVSRIDEELLPLQSPSDFRTG